jgi:predicted Co/Zn/Cd cation transporter (cation efflux family)
MKHSKWWRNRMGRLIEVDFRDMALKAAQEVKTADEVRQRCKELLEQEDYEEFLACVMDGDYYAAADDVTCALVDAYFDRIPNE